MTKVYLAGDMRASSGRVIAGNYDGKTLSLEEKEEDYGRHPLCKSLAIYMFLHVDF